jgi:hypothetical protein
LPDLVGLGLVPVSLKIDLFCDAGFPKDMMTAPRAKLKSKMKKQIAQVLERDVGIVSAVANLNQQLFSIAHLYCTR